MKAVFKSLILAGILCSLDSTQEGHGSTETDGNNGSIVSLPIKSESDIHDKALKFLKESKCKDGACVEEQFAEFLEQELGLDQLETKRLALMSFWINFVTLQHEWQPDEMEKMEMSFIQEEELKQAGFKAKGLILMASQLQEAEARFLELKQQLSATAFKGESP